MFQKSPVDCCTWSGFRASFSAFERSQPPSRGTAHSSTTPTLAEPFQVFSSQKQLEKARPSIRPCITGRKWTANSETHKMRRQDETRRPERQIIKTADRHFTVWHFPLGRQLKFSLLLKRSTFWSRFKRIPSSAPKQVNAPFSLLVPLKRQICLNE